MKLGEFLKELEITQDKFAKTLGLKSRTSLSRYEEIGDLSKIRSSRAKMKLSYIFKCDINDLPNITTQELLDEKSNIKNRIEKVEQNDLLENKVNSFPQSIKQELHKSSMNIIMNYVKYEDDIEMMKSLNCFLSLLERKDNKVGTILNYFGKINAIVESDKYQFQSEDYNQEMIENLLFSVLDDRLRTKIHKDINLSEINEKYIERIEIRKEILRENK